MTVKRKRGIIVSALVVVIVGAVGVRYVVPIWHVIHGTGVLESHPMRTYTASTEGNLKALWTAFGKYHESEGQYPESSKWMDEVQTRIRADDMSEEEAQKKLIDPVNAGKPGVYGYAMNDLASSKYKKDLNADLPIVFESTEATRNAHGDPSKIGRKGGKAITVDGKIVSL